MKEKLCVKRLRTPFCRSLFTNLCLRLSPKSLQGTYHHRIRNLSTDQVNTKELVQNHRFSDEVCAQNRTFGVAEISETPKEFTQNARGLDESLNQNKLSIASEIVKEIQVFIRSQPRWENTLTSVFPTINFLDPDIYYKVLKLQNNVFLSLRFYLWLRSLSGFALDPFFCNLMFSRLIDAKAAKAAENFLDETKFEPEPRFLESYILCLCEHGLVDKAFIMFERLKMVGYCASLKTWNSALSHSVRIKRVDIFWAWYEYMIEFGVAPDVGTVGYLTLAFYIDNNAVKGYNLLRKALEDDHVPSKIVFNKLIAAFSKSGDYGQMSAVLHIMIAKNIPPDIYTYQEVINGLCKRRVKYEGFRIFNDLKDRGYFPDRVMYTTVIHGLCESKWLRDAQKVWFEMIQKRIVPNEYTYNTFIDGLCRTGSIAEAEKLYNEMISKGFGESTICYNTIISGMCRNGKMEKAQALFEEMKEKGISCDTITYNSLIRGFSHYGNIDKGLYFFHELLNLGFQPSTASFTILIEKLCTAGYVQEAKTLWHKVLDRGMEAAVFSQNKIIVGLSEQGNFEEGIAWLQAMIKSNIIPDQKTFERLIRCLFVADRLDDTLLIINYMLSMGFSLKEHVCHSLVNKLCQDNRTAAESFLDEVLDASQCF